MKITVKVIANAKEEKVVEEKDFLKIYVNAPAQEGKANKKLIEILSGYYDLSKSQIEIIKGQTSKNKVIKLG